LLANPLLDFDRLLLVKRDAANLGLPQNWQGNCALSRSGYRNAIAVLSPVRPAGKLRTLFQPEGTRFVGDVDLNFDADRLLFSSLGTHNRWHVFELGADGRNLRQVTSAEPDVDSYDPCYLPDGRILFAAFDPSHDNGVISAFNKDQKTRGEIANRPRQPVIRVSWERAMAFCDWLSQKSGQRVSLPTEAQWEYACRAGTATPLHYGAANADFGRWANLADQQVVNLCRGDSPPWIPAVHAVNDGAVVTSEAERYQPNAWGLRDMHGNVSEWTLTTYRPYPYMADGRDDGQSEGRKVVRGGSFYDRPERARSAFRLSYPPWQRVFNVGFRVVVTEGPALARVGAR
jgi:hypothetical protein